MSDDQGVIILKRVEDRADGTTVVTVDAPGWKQAEFVIDSAIVGTPQEQYILRQMIDRRIEDRAATKDLEF